MEPVIMDEHFEVEIMLRRFFICLPIILVCKCFLSTINFKRYQYMLDLLSEIVREENEDFNRLNKQLCD